MNAQQILAYVTKLEADNAQLRQVIQQQAADLAAIKQQMATMEGHPDVKAAANARKLEAAIACEKQAAAIRAELARDNAPAPA